MAIPPPPDNPADLVSAIPPPPEDPSELKDAGPAPAQNRFLTDDNISSVTRQAMSPFGPVMADIAGAVAPYAVNTLKDEAGKPISPTRALLTNDPTSGMAENWLRGAPAAMGKAAGVGLANILGVAGAPGTAGLSVPAGVLASAGTAAAGGAMMEALRQDAVQAYAAMTGRPYSSPSDVLKNVALQGGAAGVGDLIGQALSYTPQVKSPLPQGPLGGNAMPGSLAEAQQMARQAQAAGYTGPETGRPAVVNAANRAYDYMAKNFGGMSQSTIDMANKDAAEVAARTGLTREDIGGLSEKIRGTISGAVKMAQDNYAQVAEQITKGEQKEVINLKDSIGPAAAKIAEHFGYSEPVAATADQSVATGLLDQFGKPFQRVVPGAPAQYGVERIINPDEAAKFGKFASLVSKLDKASPEQVYYLQRDINAAIRSNRGTTLSAALGQLKSVINDSLPELAKQSESPALAKLASANRGYAQAMELEESAGGIDKANDAIQFIKNAYNPNKYSSQAKDTLEAIGKEVPAFGKMIAEVRYALAGEEAGHLLRPLPQTGAGAGIVAGGAMAAKEAVSGDSSGLFKRAAMAAVFPAFSPRAYLAGYQLGQGPVGQAASTAIQTLPPYIFPPAATTLAAQYTFGRQLPATMGSYAPNSNPDPTTERR